MSASERLRGSADAGPGPPPSVSGLAGLAASAAANHISDTLDVNEFEKINRIGEGAYGESLPRAP